MNNDMNEIYSVKPKKTRKKKNENVKWFQMRASPNCISGDSCNEIRQYPEKTVT